MPCGLSSLSVATRFYDDVGMKYWTLFTLRMTARVGLFLAVLLWWYSRSFYPVMALPFGPGSILIGCLPMGVACSHNHDQNIPGLIYAIHRIPDAADSESRFRWTNPRHGPYLPGLYFSPGSGKVSASVVVIEHWLLCLSFFIATIVTSVRWRNRKVQEAATVSENQA